MQLPPGMKAAVREALVVVLTCAALYGPGLASVPFYTRGEPREGLVVQEMLRSGEWLVPSRSRSELARKPPLYYWSAASAMRLLPGRPELALRLPSAVLATAAVVTTWATARMTWGAAAGLPAALVLASAFEWTRAATSARVDMTLAAAMTAVLAGWTLVLLRGGLAGAIIAALGAALGTLAKGPVALVLPALAAAGLVVTERRRAAAARLRPVAVLAVAAAVAGVWYALALARHGGAFAEVVARENLHRFVAGDDHAHGAGYLVPLALVGLLPWTAILPLALVPLRAKPRSPAAVLAASWLATGVVFFSFAAAKRSVYLLSLYPAVALLIGAAVAAPPAGGRLRRAAHLGAGLYLPGGIALAVVAAALAAGLDPGIWLRPLLKPADAEGAAALARAAQAVRVPLGTLAVVTAIVAVMVRRAIRRDAWRTVVVAVAALATCWTASFGIWIHPGIARTRSLQSFMARVDALVPPDAALHAAFPPDPGLRFYAPRRLEPWRPARGTSGPYVLLWDDERRSLEAATNVTLEVLARSDGAQPKRGRLALVAVPPEFRTGSRSP